MTTNNKETAIITAVGIGLIAGLVYLAIPSRTKPQPPKLEDFKEENTVIELKVSGRTIFEDFDKDGKVDAISLLPMGPLGDKWQTLYVAPGYEKYTLLRDQNQYAKPMPDNIRNLATKLMEDSQNLSFAIAENRYNAYTNKINKPTE